MKKIGRKLKKLREQRALTQQNVADRLKLHQSAYANIESGKRKLAAAEMVELARLFGFRLDKFLKEIEK